MPAPDRYAFADFVLERSQQRVLRLDGTALSLTPRLFDALLLFIENAGKLLDKNVLMLALWPGLVVEENNLTQVISGLRRALDDDTQASRFIETVPRRGYRFVASVRPLPDSVEQAPPDRTRPLAAQPPPEMHAAEEAPPAEEPRAGKRHWLQIAVAAGVATGLGGVGWWAWRRQGVPHAPPSPTLAVLPFKPLGAEGRDELLEVGMADSLIARLSTVPGWVVRSIGSARRFAGAEQDPLRAARELDVTWIVDGSLQRRGDQLRVTARLLRAADGAAAWSGSFDEKFSDVFDMQDQISSRVMQALTPTLQAGAAPSTQFTQLGGTRSTDAYQQYLAASRRAEGGRADSLDEAIAMFHQALAIDPGYSLAWVELAWAHRRRLWNADALPADVFEHANAALKRALALTPKLAQAQAGTGFRLYWYDFDWPGAERMFRSAIVSNPNVALAQWGLAVLMMSQGRLDEGFVHVRLARELDPMSPLFNTGEASFLLDRGLHAQARNRLERAFDIAPKLWLSHVVLGRLHLAERRTEEGIVALRRAVELAHGNSRPNVVLAATLVDTGQSEEARAILNKLQAQATTRHVPPTAVAAVHAALGEAAPALDALEHAVLIRDTRLVFLKDDPSWTSLRKEPRFVALMRKLKLDQYGPGLPSI